MQEGYLAARMKWFEWAACDSKIGEDYSALVSHQFARLDASKMRTGASVTRSYEVVM